MSVWICRAGKNSIYYPFFIAKNKIFLTWDGWNIDFRQLPENNEDLRQMVSAECGDTHRSSISNHLSQILIFRDKMSVGDWVIVPDKHSREYSFGTITSEYQYSKEAGDHFLHWRKVNWKYHNIIRATFSRSMQYSLGAYRTVFSLRNTEEFYSYIDQMERRDESGRK